MEGTKTVDFVQDGLRYRVYLNSNVAFSLRSGVTKRGAVNQHFWYGEEDYIDDVNLAINPIAVLNKVKKIVISWIYETLPDCLYLDASTNRKSRIYRKMISRERAGLERFYNIYEHIEGQFSLY